MAGVSFVNPAVEQVHVAEEVVDEGRDGVMVNLVRTADLLDAAFVHHRDAVGNFQRLFLIVGDEHAGDVNFVVQLAQPAAQFQPDFRVQRAEGFVEQQDAGLDGQRARQRDPLALASGKLRRIAAGQILQLDQPQQLVHLGVDLFFRWAHIARPDFAVRRRCSQTPSCDGRARSAERRSRHADRARCGGWCLRRRKEWFRNRQIPTRR